MDKYEKVAEESGYHVPAKEERDHQDDCAVRHEIAKRALAVAKSNVTEGKLEYELSVIAVMDKRNEKALARRDKANRA